MRSTRTARLEGALEREQHKRRFYGFTHRAPERETIDDILECQIEMSRLLDQLVKEEKA